MLPEDMLRTANEEELRVEEILALRRIAAALEVIADAMRRKLDAEGGR